MKKWKYLVPILLMAMMVMAGCNKSTELEPDETYVYGISIEGNRLEKRACDWKTDDVEEEIENILTALAETDESGEYKSAIPDEVKLETYLLEGGKLKLYFNSAYEKMDAAQELLCRAAVVQSLVQIDGVELVKIFVDEEELAYKDGRAIGYMKADDFVQNTGESLGAYQQAALTLYLPNEESDGLKTVQTNIRYNSNMSIEKVIVEQILKENTLKNDMVVFPPETKLLGVTVKDEICYVNFDEGFLMEGYSINPELSIASLVNSIIVGSDAAQVQISVNGQTDVMFQGKVDLSKPISNNLELVEE